MPQIDTLVSQSAGGTTNAVGLLVRQTVRMCETAAREAALSVRIGVGEVMAALASRA